MRQNLASGPLARRLQPALPICLLNPLQFRSKIGKTIQTQVTTLGIRAHRQLSPSAT
jgi:hypothetical protein